METIKRISLQSIPNIKPPRWRVLLDLKIHPTNGNVMGKHIGDLVKGEKGFSCLFLINGSTVTTEYSKTHTEALKAFCAWVEALNQEGCLS